MLPLFLRFIIKNWRKGSKLEEKYADKQIKRGFVTIDYFNAGFINVLIDAL